MSLLTHADLLAAHLETVSALDACAVVVDRQKDLENEANLALEKAGGALIVIGLGGWAIEDPDGDGPVLTLKHGVSLWTLPLALEHLEVAAFDSLLEELVKAVHHFRPATSNDHYCPRDWRIGVGSLMPHDTFLIYEFSASIEEDLSSPTAAE